MRIAIISLGILIHSGLTNKILNPKDALAVIIIFLICFTMDFIDTLAVIQKILKNRKEG